ncbi:HAD family hydrolase [Capnocytophaga stomatis]|uniref:HAD family hydrolase n=1 Tax=Capnocytophaga stomatis TaxID=1848904 RepID=UPI00385A6BA7
MRNKYIIFDLDDTLIYEIDFLKSAYKEIARFACNSEDCESLYDKMLDIYHQGEDAFSFLVNKFPLLTKEKLLEMYRNHFPNLKLNDGAEIIFNFCKSKNYKIGLITDGRSVTQRNKLKSLNIENIFDKIIISEEFGSSKPDERNFIVFQEEGIDEYFYIADNPKKDFIIPNKLNWTSVCLLDKGWNIHPQNFNLEEDFLPKYRIENLTNAINIIM